MYIEPDAKGLSVTYGSNLANIGSNRLAFMANELVSYYKSMIKTSMDNATTVIDLINDRQDPVSIIKNTKKHLKVINDKYNTLVDELVSLCLDKVKNKNMGITISRVSVDKINKQTLYWCDFVTQLVLKAKTLDIAIRYDDGELVELPKLNIVLVTLSRADGSITTSGSTSINKYKVRKQLVPDNRRVVSEVKTIDEYNAAIENVDEHRSTIIDSIYNDLKTEYIFVCMVNPADMTDRTLTELGWHHLSAKLEADDTLVVGHI